MMQVAKLGLICLSLCGTLAFKAWHHGRALFAHVPKEHTLEYLFFHLKHEASQHNHVLSPAATSVQIDEDYVGKVSRVTRKTSAQQVVKRTIEGCMQASYKHWSEVGYIDF